MEEETHEKPNPAAKLEAGTKLKSMAASNWPKVETQSQDDQDTIDLDNCTIDVLNVGREIWKGIPEARLIEYYHTIAPYILPYLKDRPQSLHVKLNGAVAPGLYIKDM